MPARILIVDDDAGVLHSLSRLLRRNGYEVAIHLDAEEALRAACKADFQVVLSDYRMPNMDGIEFLTKIRELSPQVVRVMLSGEADRDAILASINRAETFRFLVKPWDDQALLDTIAEAVAEHKRIGEIGVALDSHYKETDRNYRRQRVVDALEKESPGITDVNWSDNNTIVIEDTS